jgi:ketosteroid isomerase-like protein
MSAAENKEVIRNMWTDASEGNAEGFLSALADDVRYTIIGTTKFSGTFNGKQELLNRAFMPLISELETNGGMETDNLIAEGDYVVQQGRGVGRKTKSGQPYNNTYCFVYRLAAGKVIEVTEYCDTELVARAFGK